MDFTCSERVQEPVYPSPTPAAVWKLQYGSGFPSSPPLMKEGFTFSNIEQ